jgi:ATP-dependent DNA helicase RecG
MFDSKEQLLEKIQLGEDSSLELKALRFRGDRVDGPRREDLADELAALANSHDAVMVLGVDDKTREIEGIALERLDMVETWIRDICQDLVVPPLMVTLIRLRLPGSDGIDRAVMKIDVPRSLFVHKSPGGYFRRADSSKREMQPDFLARLFQQRSQSRIIRFDEQCIPDASLEDLDVDLCERFRGPQMRDDRQTLLHKLAMARPDSERWHPTVAGVLMGSREPRRWLPNAFIQAVAYRGSSVVPERDGANYQLDARDISGPLDEQIREACQFVFRNRFMSAAKDQGREDHPQFDMTAVFEAIVNAVAHRDYSIYASKIRLRMFSDRLELSSPGTLPNTMTVDSLAFRQAARNEAISSLLAKCPITVDDATREMGALQTTRGTLMDKRGEGVAIILERSERLSRRTPMYQLIDDSELLLTIYGAQPDLHRPQ